MIFFFLGYFMGMGVLLGWEYFVEWWEDRMWQNTIKEERNEQERIYRDDVWGNRMYDSPPICQYCGSVIQNNDGGDKNSRMPGMYI